MNKDKYREKRDVHRDKDIEIQIKKKQIKVKKDISIEKEKQIKIERGLPRLRKIEDIEQTHRQHTKTWRRKNICREGRVQHIILLCNYLEQILQINPILNNM